jgi:hypothetical protein
MVDEQRILRRVAATHAALVAVLVATCFAAGWPVKGSLIGGGLIALSFATFWVVARAIVEPRRKALAFALGTVKITLYFALSAAVLTGRLAADALGFTLGISAFVLATIVVAVPAAWPGIPRPRAEV